MADKLLTALDKRIKQLEGEVKTLKSEVKTLQGDVTKLKTENKGLIAMVAKAPDQRSFMKEIVSLKGENAKIEKIHFMEAKKQADQQMKMSKELARQSVIETRLKALEAIVAGLARR
ncbi:MAG: hypothetical protein ABJX32_16615 [Tateyamaria sp.]|uniref:hypothetical protein n=1 Tax=Tateyamaria sp. TaxID=1929288 RepID=UPI00329F6EBA